MINPHARPRALNAHITSERIVLERSLDARDQLDYWLPAKKKIDGLTPATRRMLDALRLALTMKSDPAKGYTFRPFANRREIAQQLGKPALVPYDVLMLRELVGDRLVTEGRRPLPVKTLIGVTGQPLQLGAGAEYVYSISKPVLYGLLVLADAHAFDQPDEVQAQPVRTNEPVTSKPGQPGRSAFVTEMLGGEGDDEQALALRHRGEDFETATHVYTWDAYMPPRGGHKKRLKGTGEPKRKGLLGFLRREG